MGWIRCFFVGLGLVIAAASASTSWGQSTRSRLAGTNDIYPADLDTISRSLALSLASSDGQAVSVGDVLQKLRIDIQHLATIPANEGTCLEYFSLSTNNAAYLSDLYFQFAMRTIDDEYHEVVARLDKLGGQRPEDRYQQFYVQIACSVSQVDLKFARGRTALVRGFGKVPISLLAPDIFSVTSSNLLKINLGPNLDAAARDSGILGLAPNDPSVPSPETMFPRITCLAQGLNMRTNPSSKAPRIITLAPGTVVTVLAAIPSGEWVRVLTSNQISGFVVSGNFTDCPDQLITWHYNPPEGLRDLETTWGVRLVPGLSEEPYLACGSQGGVFRAGPTQNSERFGTNRTTVPYLVRAKTSDGQWYWVNDASGRSGFLYRSVVGRCPDRFDVQETNKGDISIIFTPIDPEKLDYYADRVCITGSVYVRSRASSSSAVRTALNKGVSAKLLGRSGRWVHIERDGISGYVSGSWAKPCLEYLDLDLGEIPLAR